MRAGGAGCPAGLLLTFGWLLLVGLQALQAVNVTAAPETGGGRDGENESEVDEEAENDSDVSENEAQGEPEEEGEGIGSLGAKGP